MQNIDVVEKNFEFPKRAVELLIKYRLEIEEFPLNCKDSYEVVKIFWNDIASKLFKEGYNVSAVDCARIWKVLYKQYTDYIDNNIEMEADNVKYLHIFQSIDKALRGEQSLKSTGTYVWKNVSNYNFNPVYNSKGKEGDETGNRYNVMKQIGNSLEPVSSNDVISINETEKAVNSIRALSISGSERTNSDIACANFIDLNGESSTNMYSNWVDDQIARWNRFTKSTETHFVWDNDSFQCFMDLGLHVEKLLRVGKKFHDNPYTYISAKMYLYGYVISGEECQKKWKELAILYGEQLDIIKETGILENHWKKFWQMDKILQESKLNAIAGPLSFVWTKNAIVYLINIRLEADISDVKYQGYIELWQYVALKMMSYNFPFTCNECSIKWTELCEIYEESLTCISERDLNVNWDVFLSMHLGYMRVTSKVKQMIKCRTPRIRKWKGIDDVKSADSFSSLSNRAVERNLNETRINENEQNSYEAYTHFTNNMQNMLHNIYAKVEGLATKRKSLIASDVVSVEMKPTVDSSNVSRDTFDLNKVKRQRTNSSEFSFVTKKCLSEQEASNLQISDTMSLSDSMNNNLTNETDQRTFGNDTIQACKDQNINANVQTSTGQSYDSVIESSVLNKAESGLSNVTLPLNAENNYYRVLEKDQALYEASAQDLTNTRKKGEKFTANVRANCTVEEETMTFKWTEDATILLTRFRLEWELEFQILHTNRYNVWHDVAKAMQSLDYDVSSFLCESCWKHLICIYYSQYNNYEQTMCLGYSKCFKIINDALLVGIHNLESPSAQLDAIFPKLGRAKSFWTDEAIRLLINLRFSEESPKIGTMTWVTMKMQSMGYRSLTIDQCCRKWRTLYSTYKNMHIRLCQGKIVNWPYFNIMDWNLKRSGKDLRSQILNMNVTKHFAWSDVAVQSLINGISLLQGSFEEFESNLSEVHWRQIANMLIARKFQVTPQQCAEKWNSLIDEYKKTIHELRNGKGVNLEEHFMLLNKWMKKKRS